jgi:hypothetical protein
MIAPLSINSSHADCRPERSFFRSLLLVANRERLGKGLLLLNRSPGSVYEGLDLLHGKAAIFVRVHRLEDPLVSRLKLLQGDRPVTVTIHHSEEHPHHHAVTHAPGTHHAPSAHYAGAHGSSAPVLAVSPTMPVTPAHHTAIVLDIIFDGAARSLDAP